MASLNVKKGDRVVVLAGKDKGKKGEVLSASPKEQRVIVQGVNMVKRHTRASATSQGGIVEKEAPIHLSNVVLVSRGTTAAPAAETAGKEKKAPAKRKKKES